MAQIGIDIAGRTYQVACRDGEEDSLKAAARMVDAKSREALSGLGTLSESRQLLFASLLLADQLLDKPGAELPEQATASTEDVARVDRLAERLERVAETLEASVADA